MLMKKVYIAGPDVFYKESVEIDEHHKGLLNTKGFEGLYPLNNKCKTSKEVVDGDMNPIDKAVLRTVLTKWKTS